MVLVTYCICEYGIDPVKSAVGISWELASTQLVQLQYMTLTKTYFEYRGLVLVESTGTCLIWILV